MASYTAAAPAIPITAATGSIATTSGFFGINSDAGEPAAYFPPASARPRADSDSQFHNVIVCPEQKGDEFRRKGKREGEKEEEWERREGRGEEEEKTGK